MRRRGRFYGSCRTWPAISRRSGRLRSWINKHRPGTIRRRRQRCRKRNGNCLLVSQESVRRVASRLPLVGPAGTVALRRSKTKTSYEGKPKAVGVAAQGLLPVEEGIDVGVVELLGAKTDEVEFFGGLDFWRGRRRSNHRRSWLGSKTDGAVRDKFLGAVPERGDQVVFVDPRGHGDLLHVGFGGIDGHSLLEQHLV